jgi:hypothetical protein
MARRTRTSVYGLRELFMERMTSLVVSPLITWKRASFRRSCTCSGPSPKSEASTSPALSAASTALGSVTKRNVTRSSLGRPFTW